MTTLPIYEVTRPYMSANSLRKPFKVPFKTPVNTSEAAKVRPQPLSVGDVRTSPPVQNASADSERADDVEVVEISDEDHDSKPVLDGEIHEVLRQPTLDCIPLFRFLSNVTNSWASSTPGGQRRTRGQLLA